MCGRNVWEGGLGVETEGLIALAERQRQVNHVEPFAVAILADLTCCVVRRLTSAIFVRAMSESVDQAMEQSAEKQKRPLADPIEQSTEKAARRFVPDEQPEIAKQHLELGEKIQKKLPAKGPLSNGNHICMVGDELHEMSPKSLNILREKKIIIKKEPIWVCSPELLRAEGYYNS